MKTLVLLGVTFFIVLCAGCQRIFFPQDTVQLGSAYLDEIVYSSDGTKLAVADLKGNLFVIDPNTRAVLNHIVSPIPREQTVDPSINYKLEIAFSDDNQMLYGCIEYVRLADRKYETHIFGWNRIASINSGPQVNYVFNKDFLRCKDVFFGDWIAVPSQDEHGGYVTEMHDTRTKVILFKFWDKPIRLFSDHRYNLVWESGNGTIWDLRSHRKLFQISPVSPVVYALMSNYILLPCGNSDTLCLWKMSENQLVQKLNIPQDLRNYLKVDSAKLSKDGTRVAAILSSIDPKIIRDLYRCVWDISQGEPIGCWSFAHDDQSSPTEATYFVDDTIEFLPTTNNRIVTYYDGFMSPDWNTIQNRWNAQVWDADSGDLGVALVSSGRFVSISHPVKLRLSPTQPQLAAMGPTPGQLVFWDLSEL